MRRRHIQLVAMFAASVLLAAACAKNSDTKASSSGGVKPNAVTTTSMKSTGDPVQDATNLLQVAIDGTHRLHPPTSGPLAVKGKKVWIISCGQLLESCKVTAAAALEAAKKIGWDAQVVDGQLSDAAQADGVTQAVAAGVDGIIMTGIDCSKVQAPLAAAKAKGIKLISFYAFDCDDPALDQPGAPMLDSNVNFGPQFAKYGDVSIEWGKVKAEYIISKTKGKAQIIDLVNQDYLVMQYIEKGFLEGLKACPDCKVVDAGKWIQSDVLDGKLKEKLAAALQQHPEATVVHAPIDPLFAFAVNAPTAGKNLMTIGGEALPGNIDFIRTGIETAAVAFPHVWTGWAAIDTMNRLFAGEKAADIPDSGIGWQVVDKDHNLPPTGDYVPQVKGQAIDFKAGYAKVWGV